MTSKAEKGRKHKPHQAVEREKERTKKRGEYRQRQKKKPYNPAVLRLMADGLTNAEIGLQLNISKYTITHIFHYQAV